LRALYPAFAKSKEVFPVIDGTGEVHLGGFDA
jgi:hypothetical protein